MKRNEHEWKKRTPEGRRVFRAWTERGEWVIISALEIGGRAGRRRTAEDGPAMEWEAEEPAALEDLRLFREVLWNKYQRGRVAYKLVEKLDAMMESAEEREALQTEKIADDEEDEDWGDEEEEAWNDEGENEG